MLKLKLKLLGRSGAWACGARGLGQASRSLSLCAVRRGLSTTSNSTANTSTVSNELDLSVALPTNENCEALSAMRHSAAHVMAMAVQRLHPEAQVTVGPVIDNGFYYDFFFPNKQLSDSDLSPIKK